MKRIVSGLIVGTLLLGHCPVMTAADPWTVLSGVALSGNVVTITLSGAAKHHAFTLEKPERIVIEFSNTICEARQKEVAGDGTVVKALRCSQFKNSPTKISRVVIDLVKKAEYEIAAGAAGVKVTLKTPAPVVEPQSTAPADAAAEPAAAAPAPVTEAPANADTSYTLATAAAQDVSTVPTVAAADPSATASLTAAEPAPAAPSVPVVQPQKAAPKAAVEQTVKQPQRTILPKKKITFDFEEADIRDVFRILAMKSGINIIYGADVSGLLTLRLDNVAFDKAFETILAIKGLVMQDQGPGIIRVVTTQKLTEERSQAVTFTKVFPLNYAKAEEIKINLDAIRSAEGRRGSITVDARTNSLIVTDTPEGFISLGSIISELDKRPTQVIIEAKIVEVVLNKSMDLGIQWQYANTLKNDADGQVYIGGTRAETSDSALGGSAVAGATVVSPLSTSEGGTGVTFPASAVSGQISSISFGVVSNETRLTGLLTALAQKGLSKLLSSPKVTTINNKEAKIMVGQKIPYTTTTVSNTGSTQETEFLDVGIKLTVTPTINSDQKITLNVHPEVSLFVRADPAGPVIGTREAYTTVIVNNGETVVIGGLITDEDRKAATQVPLLGDIPIIGHLFRQDYKSKDRTELLVFITPQIIGS